MASLKAIAQATGVSIRTVSRALKGNGYVSSEVRTRVCEAADRMGYRPNRYARALKTRQSYEVTALVWSTDELHMKRIEGLETALRSHGYWVSLIMAHSFKNNDNEPLKEELLSRNPAAIVAIGCNHPQGLDTLAEIAAMGIKVVLVDSRYDNLNSITIDRQQGVYEAIKYLAEKGSRKIAYAGIGSPLNQANTYRLIGYRRAIGELGFPEILLTSDCLDQYEAGRDMGRRFCSIESRPDAIQAYSDLLALGMLAGFQETGISVPDDVALIGFDNRNLSQYSAPPLTTVAQPLQEVGVAAAEIMLDCIKNNSNPAIEKILPTKLIVRETA